MWTKKDGGCNCWFCQSGKEHKHPIAVSEGNRGHLQVAESLDPKDIIRTRICNLCGHEEAV